MDAAILENVVNAFESKINWDKKKPKNKKVKKHSSKIISIEKIEEFRKGLEKDKLKTKQQKQKEKNSKRKRDVCTCKKRYVFVNLAGHKMCSKCFQKWQRNNKFKRQEEERETNLILAEYRKVLVWPEIFNPLNLSFIEYNKVLRWPARFSSFEE